jgi:tagaturonate reductase
MNKLPKFLTFSFAAFMKFYQGRFEGEKFMGIRENGDKYQIRDNQEVLNFFNDLWIKKPDSKTAVKTILSNKTFWEGIDLTEIEGLSDKVSDYLELLSKTSVKESIKNI